MPNEVPTSKRLTDREMRRRLAGLAKNTVGHYIAVVNRWYCGDVLNARDMCIVRRVHLRAQVRMPAYYSAALAPALQPAAHAVVPPSPTVIAPPTPTPVSSPSPNTPLRMQVATTPSAPARPPPMPRTGTDTPPPRMPNGPSAPPVRCVGVIIRNVIFGNVPVDVRVFARTDERTGDLVGRLETIGIPIRGICSQATGEVIQAHEYWANYGCMLRAL